jgi:RNA polymerase sigma factor (sigma-70 family)
MSALDEPLVEPSLEESLQRARPRLKTLFTRYRIPVQDTEDILQQALLALLYRRQSVRDPEAWLVGTVRNKCLLYWRNQRRRLYDSVDSTVLDWMAEPLAPAQEDAELRHDLRSVVERLPERCRSILSLRYGLGYEPPEVAERMGYSTSSISKVTTRCLAALTRQLLAAGLCKKRPDR